MQLAAAGLLLAMAPGDLLTGRWESRPSDNGNITGVVFKNGNSLEGYINKKPFVSGTYFFNPADSMLSFTDNGCNGTTGVYKVEFFSRADSLHFKTIMDNCTQRRKGMERLVMGRVK